MVEYFLLYNPGDGEGLSAAKRRRLQALAFPVASGSISPTAMIPWDKSSRRIGPVPKDD
jgi:hypothetical protein